jgi:hypothetical protein
MWSTTLVGGAGMVLELQSPCGQLHEQQKAFEEGAICTIQRQSLAMRPLLLSTGRGCLSLVQIGGAAGAVQLFTLTVNPIHMHMLPCGLWIHFFVARCKWPAILAGELNHFTSPCIHLPIVHISPFFSSTTTTSSLPTRSPTFRSKRTCYFEKQTVSAFGMLNLYC